MTRRRVSSYADRETAAILRRALTLGMCIDASKPSVISVGMLKGKAWVFTHAVVAQFKDREYALRTAVEQMIERHVELEVLP